MVRGAGIEPARPKPANFKSAASTNSANPAQQRRIILIFLGFVIPPRCEPDKHPAGPFCAARRGKGLLCSKFTKFRLDCLKITKRYVILKMPNKKLILKG